MDTYTIVNKTQLESDLTTIANALRTANGSSNGTLSFPNGYVQVVNNLANTISGLNSEVTSLNGEIAALQAGLNQIAGALRTACGYANDYEFETYQDYVDAIESLVTPEENE